LPALFPAWHPGPAEQQHIVAPQPLANPGWHSQFALSYTMSAVDGSLVGLDSAPLLHSAPEDAAAGPSKPRRRRQTIELSEEHKAAEQEFRNRDRSDAQKNDPSHFKNFLLLLEQAGIQWGQFKDWSEQKREMYLYNAVTGRHLDKSAPAAVRRAISPTLAVQPRWVPAPVHPDNVKALGQLRNRLGQRENDTRQFKHLLLFLEEQGATWDQFLTWTQEKQKDCLNNAVAEGYLDRKAGPPAVRRAAQG
jgi:hypothetical protein